MTSECFADKKRKHSFSWTENWTEGSKYGVTAMEAVRFDSVNVI